jgi:hypothetical protein
MPWVIDILAGALLALLLYGLVRFRMYFAPLMRDRFGSWARWATWFVVILLMVVIANLELIWLRQILHSIYGLRVLITHEIIFALVALAGGYFLVSRHVTKKSDSVTSDKRGC